MKVALIETHAIPGVWKYDLGLANGLAELGHFVTIYTSTGFPAIDSHSGNVEIVRVFPNLRAHSSALVKGILYLIATIRTIGLIRKGRFDVVHWQHYNTFPPAETLLAKSLRWLDQKLVITVHDIDPWSAVKVSSMSLLRTTFQCANRYIVHHDSNREELSRRYGIPRSVISVVPHGSYVDFSSDLQDTASSRRILEIPEHASVVLFFGEIRPEKGLIHLIRAIAQLQSKHPDLRLVIAGRPRHMDMSECMEEIKRLKLEEVVIMRLEYIKDEHVSAYFLATDLVAIPYVAITQSGILFEAMTFGCPVVASDVGAVGPTVLENNIGIVVPPGDEEELAQAIAEIINNPYLSKKFSENGRRVAEERYSWNQCALATSKLYEHLQQS